MDIKQISGQRKAAKAACDNYATPKLKEFGPVGALTQAGTTGASEAMSSSMNKQFP